ncbi:TetR/AcrR family transcriptional regulator [Actinomadura fibrosa]|uniref:TetR/AcrR family transcriptional regulator n=1 Tax=Actinomadura fibrosa TaxID=111802 RepID=A0ABW2XRH9_9ACTN|nr:TetR/AcrR family transcriptional regulator [Actinomadura fibrosa]
MTPPPSSDAPGGRPLRADARRNRIRILTAAEAVFAEKGPDASTEEVAARAGVAIGTVFRHFPTKDDLLAAIMKDLRQRLAEQADQLSENGDPATALFTFFTSLVEQAAATRTVVDLLARTGNEIEPGGPIRELEQALSRLLIRAQQAGAIRPQIRVTEVIALLTAACQGVLSGAWSEDLRHRTLEIIFNGMRVNSATHNTPQD